MDTQRKPGSGRVRKERFNPDGFGDHLGRRMRAMRAARGLTIQQAVELSGGMIPQARWSEYEGGKLPRLDKFLAVCVALSCRPDDLLPDGFRPGDDANAADLIARLA